MKSNFDYDKQTLKRFETVEVMVSAWIALGLLVISGLILVLYHDQGSIGGLDSSSFAGLVASCALLIWLGSSVLRDYSGKLGQAFKDVLTWAGIVLILVILYTFRTPLLEGSDKVIQQLLPAGVNFTLSPHDAEKATVRLRVRDDGQFVVRTTTNNRQISMLVDTGASQVVLSARDARALGINMAALNFVIPVNTANGQTMTARYKIDSLFIGPIKIYNVEALVAREGDLNQSLLGMSFLRRLRSYEFTKDFLILRS